MSRQHPKLNQLTKTLPANQNDSSAAAAKWQIRILQTSRRPLARAAPTSPRRSNARPLPPARSCRLAAAPPVAPKQQATDQQQVTRLKQPQSAPAPSVAPTRGPMAQQQPATLGHQAAAMQPAGATGPTSMGRQLADARVKSITGKLLESRGAELRRTLFSLRQIFQEDPELAIGFTESEDGLDSLMKLASEADQIHQNYILRALDQLIAHPSGMSGLQRHGEIIQWLYSLTASQHRLVVKTSIKLLLAFVSYNEDSCAQFCDAIKAIDESRASSLCSNLVALFKKNVSNQHQDVGLLIDAITLINRILIGAPNRQVYYELLDSLEESGMDSSIVQKYSDLDAQLREQFKLYEQTLEVEPENENNHQQVTLPSQLAAKTMDEQQRNLRQNDSLSSPNDNLNGSTEKTLNTNITSRTSSSGDDDVHQQQHHQRRRSVRRALPMQHIDLAKQQVLSSKHRNAKVNTNSNSSGNNDDPDLNESGETTNDDDYVSANEKPNETNVSLSNDDNKQASASKRSDNIRLVVQTLSAEQQQQSSKRQQHQLQLRQQQPPQYQRANSTKQNDLARGYASGSGNSTDHEHKQQLKQQQQQQQQQLKNHSGAAEDECKPESQTSKLETRVVTGNYLNKTTADKANDSRLQVSNDNLINGKHRNHNCDNDDDNENNDEVGTQLKQHLSELEQLTDELSKRDIFHESPTQSTSKHFSSTIKSNASSVLSTASDISSNLAQEIDCSTKNNALRLDRRHVNQQHDLKQTQACSPSPPSLPDNGGVSSGGSGLKASNGSRSTSTTPTSCIQPMKSTASSSSYTQQQATAATYHQVRSTSDEMAINQTKPMRTTEEPFKVTSNTSSPLHQSHGLQANVAAPTTPSKQSQQQHQEPYYHNLFQWEQLVSKGVTRPLLINDLDFTDLRDDDDCDLLSANNSNQGTNKAGRNQATGEPLTINIPAGKQGIKGNLDTDSVDSGASTGSPRQANASGTPASAPPPLPPPPISPWFNTISGSSRPQSQFLSSPSPPACDYPATSAHVGQHQLNSNEFNRDQSPANSTYSSYSRNSVCLPQHMNSPSSQHFNALQTVGNLRSASSMSSLLFGNNGKYANKRKKTMKLFWKEVREDRSLLSKITKKKTIWDEIKPVQVDTQKLEYLFESKAKDLLLSKSRNGLDGSNQRKLKITVLDAKRSNAINIGMTKLPPMRTIKSAILKMDSSIMNREGIEKILTTMMPSEEEKSRIIEAQLANPDTPLGTAEQFLLNLASISALEARLKLWAFQLDYAQIEKEVAEPLMDLKQAIAEIEGSETFRIILGTLLAIGNFLNSTSAKGFQIDYLEKVPEVKDTVHKHSLLHHLCLFIQEKYDPELTSDLYSEFSAVNRASKVDYTEVAKNLKKMQQDCRASWDYLKIVTKHDGLANLMNTCGSVAASSASSSSVASNSTCNSNSTALLINNGDHLSASNQPKTSGKLNNLSKLSMITTIISSDVSASNSASDQQQIQTTKQLKTKVSDFLTDCAERIMMLIVIHRRVMNRFQKLLVYLGCPSHQIKQTQPQQILKIINEFALEYRTKRERVREMLLRTHQQCSHHRNHGNHHHQLANRWQLNRLRWAGSQQCIDTLNGYNNRPCSVSSSYASSAYGAGNLSAVGTNCPDCALDAGARHRSVDPHHYANQRNQTSANQHQNHRPGSPSGLSQISNYSDYLFDHSCCNSRQFSVTPVPSEKGSFNCLPGVARARPHSMSASMFDLQQQQQQQQQQFNNGRARTSMPCDGNVANGSFEHEFSSDEIEKARQKDEQLRRLLGAGKSLDGACEDLYQMSHWSTTMTRRSRQPPPTNPLSANKQRAASIDSPSANANNTAGDSSNDSLGNHNPPNRRQSSYYRHLNNISGCQMNDDDMEQNSDEEILQSLVRAATSKSLHNNTLYTNGAGSNRSNDGSGSSGTPNSSNVRPNKSAKNKILSRFSCDRKSMRRSLGPGLEMSNA